MTKQIIITGAMGSGKSTALQLLEKEGFTVVPEPAREILAEQRLILSEGVPEKNPQLFTQLLLSRAIYQYKQMKDAHNLVIFDRGIPDNVAYAKLFNLDAVSAHQAAKLYPYHSSVFLFPAWEEIYTTDDERRMSFADAKKFGEDVQKIYREFGYHLIEVPCISAEERVQFIKKRIALI